MQKMVFLLKDLAQLMQKVGMTHRGCLGAGPHIPSDVDFYGFENCSTYIFSLIMIWGDCQWKMLAEDKDLHR